MDDTFANEQGIPILPSYEDVPVHSTPIKGTKIPLPSTRLFVKKPPHRRHRDLPRRSNSEPGTTVRQSEDGNMSGQRHEAVTGYDAGQHVTETMQTHSDNVDNQGRTTDIVSTGDFRDSNRKHVRFYPKDTPGQDEYESPNFVRSDTAISFPNNLKENRHRPGQSRPNCNVEVTLQSRFSTQRRAGSPESLRTVEHITGSKTAEELLFTPEKQHHSHGLPKPHLHKHSPAPESDGDSIDYQRDDNKRNSNAHVHGDGYRVQYSDSDLCSTDVNNTNPHIRKAMQKQTPETDRQTNGLRGDKLPTNLSNVETTSRISQGHRGGNSHEVHKTYNSHYPVADRTSDMSGKSSVNQTRVSDLEMSTVDKQRQEIQLLVTELRSRDQELGDILRSQQQQLVAWEQDRQRLIMISKKCSQHEDELQQKSGQLCNALASLNSLKSQQSTESAELETMRGKLESIARINEKQLVDLKQETERSAYLQKTIDDLSMSVGRMQAREEEITTNLRLKEKEMAAATGDMRDLSERLRQLDRRCKESQATEREALKQQDHWKHRHDSCLAELQAVKDQMTVKSKDTAQLLEENRSLRQHLDIVQKEAGMRERCKDEIIDSMKMKQERTDSQLKSIRELYERQLREASILQLHLDTSKDIISKQQNSLEEQQLTASYSNKRNSQMSEHSSDHIFSRRSYELTSPTQPNHYKDFEPSLQQHTLSSGYQTQTSGNQSELTEHQTSSSARHHSYSHTTGQQSAGYRLSDQYQPPASSQSQTYQQNTPHSQHSRFDEAICDHNRRHSNQSETTESTGSKKLICDSDRKINRSPSNTNRVSKSVPTASICTNETSAKMANSPTKNNNKRNLSVPKTNIHQSEQDVSRSDSRHDRYVLTSHAGVDAEHPAVLNSAQENSHPTSRQSAVFDVDKQYVFENKLRSFLDEIEDVENIHDSIWEDSGSISAVTASQVEGSPGSKLQRLLLESQMMIHNLEASHPPASHTPEGAIQSTCPSSTQQQVLHTRDAHESGDQTHPTC